MLLEEDLPVRVLFQVQSLMLSCSFFFLYLFSRIMKCYSDDCIDPLCELSSRLFNDAKEWHIAYSSVSFFVYG